VSTAREEILDRIRAAVLQPGAPGGPGRAAVGRVANPDELDAAYAALPRDYRRAHHDAADTDIVALFAERAADYRAVVERIPEADLAAAIARVLADLPTVMVPAGLPPQWLAGVSARGPVEAAAADPAGRPAGGRIVRDDPPLSARELDSVAGVVTGCAAAIAETGTIILDHGPGQGRRALTLVPDFHLVVVLADQVAADLPDAIARLDPARPHTLISGPSATSDIELIRVEGVHGPRNLHILIAGLPDGAISQLHRRGDEHEDHEAGDEERYHRDQRLARFPGDDERRHDPEHSTAGEGIEAVAEEGIHVDLPSAFTAAASRPVLAPGHAAPATRPTAPHAPISGKWQARLSPKAIISLYRRDGRKPVELGN
jgi:L-lactate dehydrogenase complex protein LldG